MLAKDYKAKYIKPEFVNRFCVISFHNSAKWIELHNDDEIPKNMQVGIRMRADLSAWLTYEEMTGNENGP